MAMCKKCAGFGKLKDIKCECCGQTLICDKCGGSGWIRRKEM
jgi:hypothetical protein